MEHRSNADKKKMELQHADITRAIIGAAFEVYNVLGYGFLEKVYQLAMQVELQARGFKADTESEILVKYKGVELKVAKSYTSDDEPQLLNELKATGVKVGLLINFGRTKVEFQRMVF
jgi:hypothetical protein